MKREKRRLLCKRWEESRKEEDVQRESRAGGRREGEWNGIVKRGKRYERKVLDAAKTVVGGRGRKGEYS